VGCFTPAALNLPNLSRDTNYFIFTHKQKKAEVKDNDRKCTVKASKIISLSTEKTN
jgi:hypothetical protein